MPHKRCNILLIYADDLGFGDLACYGAQQIPTPNIDSLVRQGRKFMNAHSAAATCTPARYSLLTGAYPFRHPRAHILAGDSMSLFADGGHETIAQRLQKAGYRTGIVGKWHLGLGDGQLNWNGELRHTPNDAGFASSYIMAATNDRVPCVYVDNRRVENLNPQDPIFVSYDESERGDYVDFVPGYPTRYGTGRDHPERLKLMFDHGHDGSIFGGVSRIGYMKGGESALWDDQHMAEVFAAKAKEFIHSDQDTPFFLFYALHQPHVPRIVSPRFAGTTPYGARGDSIAELDWCVGEVLREIQDQNTLVIFSSDNGPVLQDGYADFAEEKVGNHKQAGPLRGGKYSLFDGGTRVPTVLSWPGVIPAGNESWALVSQTDFYASLLSMLGLELNETEAPDSLDMSSVLLGASEVGRRELITEGVRHNTLLHSDDWVFIPPYDGPAISADTHIELGNSQLPQLYHTDSDIGQQQNLAQQEPERLRKFSERLETLLAMPQTR